MLLSGRSHEKDTRCVCPRQNHADSKRTSGFRGRPWGGVDRWSTEDPWGRGRFCMTHVHTHERNNTKSELCRLNHQW